MEMEMKKEMEMGGGGYIFHSRTTGIEGILVFFFLSVYPHFFFFFRLRFLFPATCPARV
jgi:hypothetical protein